MSEPTLFSLCYYIAFGFRRMKLITELSLVYAKSKSNQINTTEKKKKMKKELGFSTTCNRWVLTFVVRAQARAHIQNIWHQSVIVAMCFDRDLLCIVYFYWFCNSCLIQSNVDYMYLSIYLFGQMMNNISTVAYYFLDIELYFTCSMCCYFIIVIIVSVFFFFIEIFQVVLFDSFQSVWNKHLIVTDT